MWPEGLKFTMIERGKLFHTLSDSPFGPFAVVWGETPTGAKVFRVILSSPKARAFDILKKNFPASLSGADSRVSTLAGKIVAFLEGEAMDFSLDDAVMEICSPFQRRVLLAEYGIPRGRISTYFRIARHIGCERGARAVGTALANNPFPILIPCHRAVRADGGLGGYQGGLEMKRRLLELEGLKISPQGRITGGIYHY